MRMKPLFLTSLVATVAISALGCTVIEMARQAKATRNSDFTIPIPEQGKLEIRTVSGKVECIAADIDEIQVEAEITAYGRTLAEAEEFAEMITIERTERDGIARIEADIPRGISAGISLLVILPGDTELNVRTSNGKIEATGMSAAMVARTSNGEIVADECAGGVEAKSSNGKISIRGSSMGKIKAVTSNGSVRIKGRLSIDEHLVSTSNGSVRVETYGPPVRVIADTRNGRIRANGKKIKRGKTVVLGDPKDEFGDDVAKLTLDTSNGSITIDHADSEAKFHSEDEDEDEDEECEEDD